MALTHIAGSQNPLKTVSRKSESTNSETFVEISGPYATVADMQPKYGDGSEQFPQCPTGFTVAGSTLTPDGRGGAVLSVRCVDYTNQTVSSSVVPVKTVYSIEMVATVYELKQHPTLTADAATVKMIALWLGSPISVQYAGATGFSYNDESGQTQQVPSGSNAHKFCAAYTAGITTFTRYYPVIVKTSIWKSLPGATMVGNSQTGGTISQFSAGIGTWDTPDITLNGYASTNWFKSGDRWNQNQDQTYTRNEQWTYSPDGSSGAHGWIYASSQGSSQGQGGSQT